MAEGQQACGGLLFIVVAAAVLTSEASVAGAQSSVRNWTLTPVLRIDGEKHDLISPTFVLVDRAGRMLLGQGQDNQIVMFDASGKRAGTIGRTGSGPGEFRMLTEAGFVGDSLWAYDIGLRRTTVFTPTNRYARAISLTSVSTAGSEFAATGLLYEPQTRAVYGDGTLLVLPGRNIRNVQNASPPGIRYWRVAKGDSTVGTVRKLIAQLPSDLGTFIHWTSDSSNFGFTIPGFPSPLHAVSADGQRIVVVTTTLKDASAGTLTIEVLSGEGERILKRDIPVATQSLTKRAADSMLAARSKILQPAVRRIFDREAPKRMPVAIAPATFVQLGRDGTIWVALQPTSSSKRYLVLDAAAIPIGNVTVPRNTRVAVADRTNLWAVETTEDGIPNVVRYRIAQ